MTEKLVSHVELIPSNKETHVDSQRHWRISESSIYPKQWLYLLSSNTKIEVNTESLRILTLINFCSIQQEENICQGTNKTELNPGSAV